MSFALVLAALRRHPFSIPLTFGLLLISASLLHIPVPLALADWLCSSLLAVELWYTLEPMALRRLAGLRDASHNERALVDAAIGTCGLQLLIEDQPDLAVFRGLRCLVVSRDLLELLEQRALSGLLHQAAAPVHCADLAGVTLVRLGSGPVLLAWWVTRLLGLLGRLLGVIVGEALVVPVVIWPGGFIRWSGRVFGAVIVGLLGAMLLSSGFAAAGLGLLVAWAVVPGLHALLGWESRRVERAADQATLEAGFGAQLLEALEFLMLAEPRPELRGVARVLCQPGAPLTSRADRLRKALMPIAID